MRINFRTSDFSRRVANSADLILRNRYFEQNPSLNETGQSLIARPGLSKLTTVGSGPIRCIASQPGSFNGDLFVASGDSLYRESNTQTQTFIGGGLFSPTTGPVSIAITAQICDGPSATPAFAYIADGRNLWVYVENGYSKTLLSGTPVANDVVQMGGIYYKFTAGSVNTGSPAGTSANPWLVALGSTAEIAFQNLVNATYINGVAGTDYSTAVTPNPYVKGVDFTSNSASFWALIPGNSQNFISTTTTSVGMSFTGTTLQGGGLPSFTTVKVPDDKGAIDVAVISSFVIVIPVQTDGYQGRFYWIQPGATTIDPLDFATAEYAPDGLYGVQICGDQFWLPGASSTEVWYVSTTGANIISSSSSTSFTQATMVRLQGIMFNRGAWENTAVDIHEKLIITDADGGVFLISGGSPTRVSTPDIEEEIRTAMARQTLYLY